MITTRPRRLITDFNVSLNETQFVNCENELSALFIVRVFGNSFFYIIKIEIFSNFTSEL